MSSQSLTLRLLVRIWTALTVLVIVYACGSLKKDKDKDDSPPEKPKGCLQGVVIDGLTGARVLLPKADKQHGIYSLVRSSFLTGRLLTSNDEKGNPNLHGEYVICGLPLDEEFPVFAWVDGYLPYESTVTIDSTISARTAMATEDIALSAPTKLINIRLYPEGQSAKDLTVTVVHDGVPLKDATVYLRPTGGNILNPSGSDFHPPVDVRQIPLTATTDDTGAVTFKANELVLGGHYTYIVLPPDGGSAQTLDTSAATFILGLRTTSTTESPYQIYVDLAHSVGGLAEISRSTDSGGLEPTGKLVVYFDREIELIPGTEDNITASLSGTGVTATLKANISANNASEQVSYEINKNVLTLTPIWETEPDADPSKEISLQVSYSGITVRPKDPPVQSGSKTVSGTVRFYR